MEELAGQGFADKTVCGGRSYYSISDKGRNLGPFHRMEDLAGYLDFIVADNDVMMKVLGGIEKINANSSEREAAKWYQGAKGNRA